MDGITLSVLGSLVASQFFIYYRLGRIEERLKNIENNTKIRWKYGINKGRSG